MIDYARLPKITPSCPLCEGTGLERLASNDRYGMGIQTAGCTQCGLVQTWPRLSAESMSWFYREQYRQYYQAAAAPDVHYIKHYHKSERLNYTAKLIAAQANLFPGMRVLDIGCSEGTLIANLRSQCDGLVCTGVEPSKSFADYARQTTGCTIYADLDALFAAGIKKFDLIIVNHVLEHVDDPVIFLRRLKALLVLNGKIYVDVPDAVRYTEPHSLHIAHIFHFSKRTLSGVFEKAGLWVIASSCHEPPHHPLSIWCVAENRETNPPISLLKAVCEKDAWVGISRAGNKLPFYLFKARLRRIRLISSVWKRLNKLRGRTA